MGSNSQSMISIPALSTTGILARNPSDEIRHLNPAIAPTLNLIEQSTVDGMGQYRRKSGLISKKGYDTRRVEWFTFTPITIAHTATGGSSSTAIIADSTPFTVKSTVYNATQDVFGEVYANNTSTNTLSITSVGSTWACSAGDKLILCANAFEDGSSDPAYVSRDEDNNYNVMQEYRFPVFIGWQAKNVRYYGGDIKARKRQQNMDHALRLLEHSLYIGKRASSGDTTTVGSGTTYAVGTSQGIWHYAQHLFPVGGTMTPEKFQKDLYEWLPSTLAAEGDLIMPCGRKQFSEMQQWANDGYIHMDGGEKDTFGVIAKKFYCGNLTIRPLLSDLFDQAGMNDKALMFSTDDIEYCFLNNMDLDLKENIQDNDVHGDQDEITGTFCVKVWSGGQNVVKLSGWA